MYQFRCEGQNTGFKFWLIKYYYLTNQIFPLYLYRQGDCMKLSKILIFGSLCVLLLPAGLIPFASALFRTNAQFISKCLAAGRPASISNLNSVILLTRDVINCTINHCFSKHNKPNYPPTCLLNHPGSTSIHLKYWQTRLHPRQVRLLLLLLGEKAKTRTLATISLSINL